jgi:hypothetical protein
VAAAPNVPHLPYDTIRARADEFAARYHPRGTIPVPIEAIVELQLRLDIVPVPGLRHHFEIDGFTTSDGREIHVDERAAEDYPARYHFTLAHEVGHLELHRWAYTPGAFTTVRGWKDYLNSLPVDVASRLEIQAHCFAGLLLVPQGALVREVDAAVGQINDAGHRLVDLWYEAWPRIEAVVAKTFCVSTEVVHRRIEYDKLQSRYRDR